MRETEKSGRSSTINIWKIAYVMQIVKVINKKIMRQNERKLLVKNFHEYNRDTQECHPNYMNLPDYAIFGLLSYKIKNNIQQIIWKYGYFFYLFV
jgi:hypothetical protein